MTDFFTNQGNNMVKVPTGYNPDKYEREALESINFERSQWDDAAVFVTERKQYLMRKVIDKARRYYSGIFENEKDEYTGDDKIWVPLTEWSVESIVKSVDLDTKDILIQPGTVSAINIVPIIRSIILNLLKKLKFGSLLNDVIRVLSRDGTAVIKTFEVIDPQTKRKVIKSKIVDILDIWIDPSAESIQDSESVIERSRVSESELDEFEGIWDNLEFARLSFNVPRTTNVWSFGSGKMPHTETWEKWGKIKKSWVTKKDKDEDTWIEGHIVASGLGSAEIAHVIRENPRKDGVKPYEDVWYRKIDGRWYGRGVAEMLFGLQEYTNIIINTRKSNNMVLQNGIFLIRRGSGITPDMVSSISAGGGIPVTDINQDIKQLPVQDVRASSYQDEDRTYLMADRVTSSFDINRGEAGRASASATATLTQDRNIRDTFVLVQEGIGFFIENLIIRQYIPMLKNIMKPEDIVRVTGDADVLTFIDEAIINSRLNKFIREHIQKTSFRPEDSDIEEFKNKQNAKLRAMGKNRFIKYFKNIFDENIDVEVNITDERFNRVVAIQHLRDSLIAFSRLPVASKLDADAVFKEMFNLMGLKSEFFLEKAQIPATSQKAGEAGRLLKELPEGLPGEASAFGTASKFPQVKPLDPRLNISTKL